MHTQCNRCLRHVLKSASLDLNWFKFSWFNFELAQIDLSKVQVFKKKLINFRKFISFGSTIANYLKTHSPHQLVYFLLWTPSGYIMASLLFSHSERLLSCSGSNPNSLTKPSIKQFVLLLRTYSFYYSGN